MLQFLGMIGGLVFWIILGWMAFTRRGRFAFAQLWQMPEYRCRSCADYTYCPASDSGPIYPCLHYEEVK